MQFIYVYVIYVFYLYVFRLRITIYKTFTGHKLLQNSQQCYKIYLVLPLVYSRLSKMILYMLHGQTQIDKEYENIIFTKESSVINEKKCKISVLFFLEPWHHELKEIKTCYHLQ